MNQKCSRGFSLLEVLLAVVVITIAGLGAYSLFDSGLKSNNITEAANEVVEIANVYTDLASSNLTTGVTTTTIVSLLQNSGRLPQKYFPSATTMANAFGNLTFDPVSPYSFTVLVPLGTFPAGSTSSIPADFCKKVQDVYSCTTPGTPASGDTPATPAASTCTVTACKLTFSMNN